MTLVDFHFRAKGPAGGHQRTGCTLGENCMQRDSGTTYPEPPASPVELTLPVGAVVYCLDQKMVHLGAGRFVAPHGAFLVEGCIGSGMADDFPGHLQVSLSGIDFGPAKQFEKRVAFTTTAEVEASQ